MNSFLATVGKREYYSDLLNERPSLTYKLPILENSAPESLTCVINRCIVHAHDFQTACTRRKFIQARLTDGSRFHRLALGSGIDTMIDAIYSETIKDMLNRRSSYKPHALQLATWKVGREARIERETVALVNLIVLVVSQPRLGRFKIERLKQ